MRNKTTSAKDKIPTTTKIKQQKFKTKQNPNKQTKLIVPYKNMTIKLSMRFIEITVSRIGRKYFLVSSMKTFGLLMHSISHNRLIHGEYVTKYNTVRWIFVASFIGRRV